MLQFHGEKNAAVFSKAGISNIRTRHKPLPLSLLTMWIQPVRPAHLYKSSLTGNRFISLFPLRIFMQTRANFMYNWGAITLTQTESFWMSIHLPAILQGRSPMGLGICPKRISWALFAFYRFYSATTASSACFIQSPVH